MPKNANAPLAGKGEFENTQSNYTRPRIKYFIVYMALCGLIHISLAEWLIRVGGFRHE